MAKRQPTSEQMPLHGEIVQGPLAGWRYAFLRFVAIEQRLYMDLRCTPPAWPFPQTVRFSVTHDKFKLRADPGARRLDALTLMATAMEHGACAVAIED